ncbi:hypothetical protein GN956_G25424, partial [Arapaima gigas]
HTLVLPVLLGELLLQPHTYTKMCNGLAVPCIGQALDHSLWGELVETNTKNSYGDEDEPSTHKPLLGVKCVLNSVRTEH